MVLTKKMKEQIKSLLNDYEKKGAPSLGSVIQKIKSDLERKETLNKFNVVITEF